MILLRRLSDICWGGMAGNKVIIGRLQKHLKNQTCAIDPICPSQHVKLLPKINTHSIIHERKLAGYASTKKIHGHFTTKTQVARDFMSSFTLFSGCEDSVTSPVTFDHFKIFSSHRSTALLHKSNEMTLFFN